MFTENVFINKNTDELKRYILKLGYVYSGTDVKTDGPYKSLYCSSSGRFYEMYSSVCPSRPTPVINCGDNEELFKALIALRDDNDRNQWFVDDTYGIWERTESELPSRYMQMEGHKATREEIIEKFK